MTQQNLFGKENQLINKNTSRLEELNTICNMEKKEAGIINVAKIKESIKTIELFTEQYKRKRITTEQYIKIVHENLSHLTTQRDYLNYLNNIGQN